MNQTTIAIKDIQVIDRLRKDYGDLTDLDTISLVGLIQPIVLQEKDGVMFLVAGGRRYAKLCQLGYTELHHGVTCDPKRPGFVWRTEVPDNVAREIELYENLNRKDMTWQETALSIREIHTLKCNANALDSQTWGQRQTGEMLGVSGGHINYCLTIANLLRGELDETGKVKEGARFWKCDSLADAWRLWCRDKADELTAELARRHQEAAVDPMTLVKTEQALIADHDTDVDQRLKDILEHDGYKAYVNEVSNTPYLFNRVMFHYLNANKDKTEQDFTKMWAIKVTEVNEPKLVYLSHTLVNANSIEFMHRPANAGRFDHVITDIPYGIDMDNLNQQNVHGGMSDIDTVEELHDVQYNLQLISDFFPAAFACTKPNAFVVTWGDQMLWQFMYDCAIKAGFAVQRWPITWVKTSACMNQCVAYNTTKDTEIAIVCRKPGATLAKQPQTSVITCSRDEMCKEVNHPFAKPFEAWKFLVDMVSIQGQEILEPFAGRGSGVLSMLKLERKVVGVELDVAHYNQLLENIKTLHYLKLDPDFIFK